MGKKANERKRQSSTIDYEDADDDAGSGSATNRREKSRLAAKTRRDLENREIYHLSQLLPLPMHIADNLDKSAILRLSLGYIRLKAFLGCGLERQLQYHHPYPLTAPLASTSATMASQSSTQSAPISEGSQQLDSSADEAAGDSQPEPLLQVTTSSALLSSLQGFLMVVAADGSIIYISSNIRSMLGLREVELVGNNLLDFVHADDHADIQAQLAHLRQDHAGNAVSPSAGSAPSPKEPKYAVADSARDSTVAGVKNDAKPLPLSDGTENISTDECSFAVRMKCFLDKKSGGGSKAATYELIRMVGRYTAPKMNPTLAMETTMSLYSMVLLCRPIERTQSLENQATGSLCFQSRFQLDMKYIDCDPRAKSFTGYEADDLVGRSLYEFVHPEDSLRLQTIHSKLLQGAQTMTVFMRLMLRHSQQLWVQMVASINKNPRSGKPLYITAINYVVSHEQNDSQYHILDGISSDPVEGQPSNSQQRSTVEEIDTKASPANPPSSSHQQIPDLPPHIIAMLHTNPSVAGEIVVDAVSRNASQPDSHRSVIRSHDQSDMPPTKRPRLTSETKRSEQSTFAEQPPLLTLPSDVRQQPLATGATLSQPDSASFPSTVSTNGEDWLQFLTSSMPVRESTSSPLVPPADQSSTLPSSSLTTSTHGLLPNLLQATTPTTPLLASRQLTSPTASSAAVPVAPTPPPLVTHPHAVSLPSGSTADANGSTFLQQILAIQPMLDNPISTDLYNFSGSFLNT